MKKASFIIFHFLSQSAFGQTSLGGELQIYPAGVIPSIRFDLSLNEHLNLISRVGYNQSNRHDWGKHDSEKGGGFGGGIGFETLKVFGSEFSLFGRTDFWWMDLDWENEEIRQFSLEGRSTIIRPYSSGSTQITVFQPTVGLNYQVPTLRVLSFGISFGYEINIRTSGDPVGEGGIILVGVQLSRVLQSRL